MAVGTYTAFTNTNPGGVSPSKGTGTWTLRAAAVATTSYVATSHLNCPSAATIVFHATFASVDYISLSFVVQVSVNATDWVTLPFDSLSVAKTYTLADFPVATDGAIAIPVSTSAGAYYARLMLKRAGGTAVGTVAVTAFLGAPL